MDFESWADNFSHDAASASPEEHPEVVLQDVLPRKRPQGHIIVFANEKGGVGKSTLAIHCAIALAHRGMRVLAVDCDRRQQSLQRIFEARGGTARSLGISLPQPRHFVLDKPYGAQLLQEIERCDARADFVVIDLPGSDSPIARRGIALADTLVTPVNSSHAELDSLARMNPVNHEFRSAGPFAEVVAALRDKRRELTGSTMDWMVVKNRFRRREHRLVERADAYLAIMAGKLCFRVEDGLPERLAYRELLSFGLTQLDLPLIPTLGSLRSEYAAELRNLIELLNLPQRPATMRPAPAPPRAPVLPDTARRYKEALSNSACVRA